MKKLISYIVSVVVLLIITDFVFGLAAELYIDKYGLRGDYQPVDYVIKRTKDDILLVGSSVVMNSVMPTVVEDSVGYTCYNAGANSQTMAYYCTILDCVFQRYTPKCIVLGLRPEEMGREGLGRYNLLVPYYGKGYSEMDSILESGDKYNKYFFKSNLYRYNTIWFRILLYHFLRSEDNSDKGFVAHEQPLFLPDMMDVPKDNAVAENKMKLFNDIVAVCKERGVTLIVYFPPMYNRFAGKFEAVKEVERICSENGFQCYYDAQDSLFLQHKEWFYDNTHLNKYGALEYSKMFASRLKSILEK